MILHLASSGALAFVPSDAEQGVVQDELSAGPPGDAADAADERRQVTEPGSA